MTAADTGGTAAVDSLLGQGHKLGKLGSSTGDSWADLQRSGYGSWLVDELVSAIPRSALVVTKSNPITVAEHPCVR